MDTKSIWPELTDEVAREFNQATTTSRFKRGEYVYRSGDKTKGLYFVKQGLVGLTMIGASSGREHLLRFFTRGQFFGHRAMFSNEGYHASALVLENSEIDMIPKNIICDVLARNPQMYREFINVLARELRKAEEQHVMILENEIIPRTAQALVYLKELKPDHNWTRQEIANYCGSTVSTVIKAMAELEDQGLISQNGREFNLLNREKLIALQG